jgi:hypothetical protein
MIKLPKALSSAMILSTAVLLLSGCSSNENLPEAESDTWNIVRDAYVFTFPLVIMDATAQTSTNTVEATNKQAPVNQLIHSERLANAESKSVVTPNVDTLYSQAFFDLSGDAIVFRKPAADRFCSIEIMDAYTNCSALLGTGGDTQNERTYLLTGPAFDGETPAGMTRVALPTNSAWMIARTIVNDEADLPNVYALQDGMALVPLGAYLENGFDYTPPQGDYNEEDDYVPVEHVLGMTAEEYFNRANELLAQNPPAAADAPMMERLAQINVGPEHFFDPSLLGEDAEQKWKEMLGSLPDGLAEESALFKKEMGAWDFYGAPIAEFGTEYSYRALIALGGLGANPVSVAIYPKTDVDDSGQPLSAQNSYRIHFEKDALPPTMEYGFWSVTAYGEDNFLIDNSLNRYAINDRSAVAFNGDGSLDILARAEPPEDESMMDNWLPVRGKFHLVLRIYLPAQRVIEGTWQAPSISAY